MATKKNAELQAKKIVEKVLKDKSHLSNLLNALLSKQDSERYPNAIALETLSEEYPELIYPEWNFFVDLLRSQNAYQKSIVVSTIANLTALDKGKKFKEVFEAFFNLMDDKSVIVTRKLAIVAGKIAIAIPSLRTKVISALLGIDNTRHTSSRKDLIKGDIVESVSMFFKDIENKEQIIKFVKSQLKSSSPNTIKKAKQFLSKWAT